MTPNYNCKHWHGHKTCALAREHRLESCAHCTFYEPRGPTYLVSRGSELGGVLKASCLPQLIKERSPDAHVTWLTSKRTAHLVARIPYVDRTIEVDGDFGILTLQALEFDWVLSLDPAAPLVDAATLARTTSAFGFFRSKAGTLISMPEAFSPIALYYGLHGHRLNKQDSLHTTLSQSLVNCGIIDRPLPGYSPSFRQERPLQPANREVLLNVGASARWETKALGLDLFTALKPRLDAVGWTLRLLIGPEDTMRVSEQRLRSHGIHDDDVIELPVSLDEGINTISRSMALISGDSFLAHLGAAVGIPTVVVFGPTSNVEWAILPNVRTIVSDLECSPCYQERYSECSQPIKATCTQPNGATHLANRIFTELVAVSR